MEDADPKSPKFHAQRVACLQKALERGKREVAEYFGVNVVAATQEAGEGDSNADSRTRVDDAKTIVSRVNMNLVAMRFLTMVESWHPNGEYEVAAAVGRSEKPVQTADKPLAGRALEKCVDDAELFIGPKMVKDDEGRTHYLGFGVADKILTLSNAMVENAFYGDAKSIGDGLFEVPVKAVVKKGKLNQELEKIGVMKGAVKGDSLAAKLFSGRERVANARASALPTDKGYAIRLVAFP